MIGIGPMTPGEGTARRTKAARLTERHVLALGLGVSGTFVAAAIAVAVTTLVAGGSTWAALHLALAGAATVAIGAFMPHFAVTLAGTRPAAAIERLVALVLLGAGSLLAVLGVTLLGGEWAVGGAALLVGGLAGTARHTIAPLRDPLARRHPVVLVAYLVALAELAVAVVLGALGAIGLPAVIGAWATLRGAHAWLALFGAVSLTIFATLVYLAPTVLGARIRPSPWLAIAYVGILAGPLLVALAFALDVYPLALVGSGVTLAGGIAQIGYVADTYRRRGPYTSEHDWRRVAVGHLFAGPIWFALAVAAFLLQLALGRPLAGWSIELLAIPMVAGWMLQELVGSWTHLLPSVTPGGPALHASQRRVLAVASRTRLVTWNVGVWLAWTGLAVGIPAAAAVGAVAVIGTAAFSVALLLRALTLSRT